MIRLGGRQRGYGGLGQVPVQPQLDLWPAFAQQRHRLLVSHRRQGRLVHGHDFVTRLDSPVAQSGLTHQGANVVPQGAAVHFAQRETQTAADLCHLDVKFLQKKFSRSYFMSFRKFKKLRRVDE